MIRTVLTLLLWLVASAASAQPVTVIGPITVGDCPQFSSNTVIKDGGFNCNGSASIAGGAIITGGTPGGVLYDNAGVLGISTTLPTGLTAPNLTAPSLTVTTAFTATGLVTNADLVSPTISINSTNCTLGSTCSILAGSGTVTGPVSSTNNAVPRWNGTTGIALLNSGVTIDGSNNIVTPGNVTALALLSVTASNFDINAASGQQTIFGSTGSSNNLVFSASNAWLYPTPDNTISLGLSSQRWSAGFFGTTASTSPTTGAIVATGGIGIGGAAWIGGTLNVAGAATLANITGSTQCLQANTSGVVAGAGGACVASPTAANTQTSNYILVIGDAGKEVFMNISGANTLTIPPNSSVAFPVGTAIFVTSASTSSGTTITPGAGVTIRGTLVLAKAGVDVTGTICLQEATNVWICV